MEVVSNFSTTNKEASARELAITAPNKMHCRWSMATSKYTPNRTTALKSNFSGHNFVFSSLRLFSACLCFFFAILKKGFRLCLEVAVHLVAAQLVEFKGFEFSFLAFVLLEFNLFHDRVWHVVLLKLWH